MKKLYWLSVLALSLNLTSASAQEQSNAYDFPIKPGTEAWKKFKTGQEMKDACQIPSHIIKSMSTQALINTYLNYPLLSSIHVYNDLQTGFEKLTQDFNGLQELLTRKDAGKEVLKIYQQMEPNAMDKEWSLDQQGAFSFRFTYIEILLAQYILLDDLTLNEKKLVVEESLKKFKAKDNNQDVFSGFGLLTSALVMGRIVEEDVSLNSNKNAAGNLKKSMEVFLNNAVVQDVQIVNQIVSDAQMYLR